MDLQAAALAASEDGKNWANAFKKHLTQRRALPTTIESFDEDEEGNHEVNFYPKCVNFPRFPYAVKTIIYCIRKLEVDIEKIHAGNWDIGEAI